MSKIELQSNTPFRPDKKKVYSKAISIKCVVSHRPLSPGDGQKKKALGMRLSLDAWLLSQPEDLWATVKFFLH